MFSVALFNAFNRALWQECRCHRRALFPASPLFGRRHADTALRGVEQGVELGRLGQVGVETRFDHQRPRLGVIPGCQGDDLQRLATDQLAQGDGRFIAVHDGHADIEEDDFGGEVDGGRQRFAAAVSGMGGMAVRFQQRGDGVGGVVVVIDDENTAGYILLAHGLSGSGIEAGKMR